MTTSLRPEEHPEPVVQTWSYAFEMVQQSNSQAYELLQLCALLSPDAIPEEILLADVTAQSFNSQSPGWQAISVLELEYIPCLLTAYAGLLTRMRYHNEAVALNSFIVTN